MKLSLKDQKKVIALTTRDMQSWYEDSGRVGHIEQHCLLWAFFTTRVLIKQFHLEGVSLQAGTAYWPIIDEEQDDGVSPNQYGYQWEWDAKSKNFVMEGFLPEMHVWVAIFDKPPFEIVI